MSAADEEGGGGGGWLLRAAIAAAAAAVAAAFAAVEGCDPPTAEWPAGVNRRGSSIEANLRIEEFNRYSLTLKFKALFALVV